MRNMKIEFVHFVLIIMVLCYVVYTCCIVSLVTDNVYKELFPFNLRWHYRGTGIIVKKDIIKLPPGRRGIQFGPDQAYCYKFSIDDAYTHSDDVFTTYSFNDIYQEKDIVDVLQYGNNIDACKIRGTFIALTSSVFFYVIFIFICMFGVLLFMGCKQAFYIPRSPYRKNRRNQAPKGRNPIA